MGRAATTERSARKGQAIFAVGTDGSNEHQRAPLNNAYAYDMAVDHNGGKLYYTEVNANQLRRVRLDGKNDELLIPNLTYGLSISTSAPELKYCCSALAR